jgi:Glycosyl hydrolases family 16/Calx-beta domain
MKNLQFLIGILIITACGEKGAVVTPVEPTPSVSISSVTLFEGNDKTTFPFKVTLSAAIAKDVTVSYTTKDNTATGGKDFTIKTGTVTIPAKSTESTIEIVVLGDTLKQIDKQFEVVLSNPINATIGTAIGTGTIRNDDTFLFVPSEGYITPETYAGYEKLWNDEFNGTSLDETIWTRETGGGGWGNNELQFYTNRTDNAFVSNGNLTIEAKKENFDTRQYTSARLITKGKKDFTFGRVDIRAKLPKGKGIWPALWMLGKNIDQVRWPNCGEIDIMEVIGSKPNQVHGTIHYGQQGSTTSIQKTGTYTLPSGDFSDKFNVFSLVWTLDNIEVLVNDISYFKTNRTTVGSIYPFNEPFFMLFNVAVGGNWPGSPDATTVFPQQMVVDYVRVFKKL